MPTPTIKEIHDQMSDILSSGGGFECSNYHQEALTELLDSLPTKLARQAVEEFYAGQSFEELREGELGMIGTIIGAVDCDVKIVFKYED